MSDREKILAEVERLRKKNEVFDDKEYAQYELDVSCGYDSALEDILSFINSIPEEPVSLWHDAYKEQPEGYETVVTWNPITRSGEVIHNVMCVERGYMWAYIDDLLQKKEEPVSEDFEEAAEKYVYEEFPSVGVANTEAELAFKAGAKWQMNNTWHKPYEKPEANISGLIVIYKDKTLGFINMDNVNEKLGLDIVSDGWAYLKDILPDNEDE